MHPLNHQQQHSLHLLEGRSKVIQLQALDQTQANTITQLAALILLKYEADRSKHECDRSQLQHRSV